MLPDVGKENEICLKLNKHDKTIYNSEEYLTELHNSNKEVYHKWLNKQGPPNIYLHDQIVGVLNYLENCSSDIEQIIEKEIKENPDFDRSTNNPIVSEWWKTDEVIEYLNSFLFEVKQAIGIQPENYISPNMDIQEAEVISVDIPPTPIERIADAVEQINEKIPEKQQLMDTDEVITQEKALQDMDNHYLMITLKTDYPHAYSAVKNGIAAGIIEFKGNHFNFKCDKGCVGIIFSEAGCTNYKLIARYILINGEEPAEDTLKNNKKNRPPKEWDRMQLIFFPTTPE